MLTWAGITVATVFSVIAQNYFPKDKASCKRVENKRVIEIKNIYLYIYIYVYSSFCFWDSLTNYQRIASSQHIFLPVKLRSDKPQHCTGSLCNGRLSNVQQNNPSYKSLILKQKQNGGKKYTMHEEIQRKKKRENQEKVIAGLHVLPSGTH